MTKSELLQLLEELKLQSNLFVSSGDIGAYGAADMALLEYIDDPDISEVYLNIKKEVNEED